MNRSRIAQPFGRTSILAALQLNEALFVIMPPTFSAMLESSSSL